MTRTPQPTQAHEVDLVGVEGSLPMRIGSAAPLFRWGVEILLAESGGLKQVEDFNLLVERQVFSRLAPALPLTALDIVGSDRSGSGAVDLPDLKFVYFQPEFFRSCGISRFLPLGSQREWFEHEAEEPVLCRLGSSAWAEGWLKEQFFSLFSEVFIRLTALEDEAAHTSESRAQLQRDTAEEARQLADALVSVAFDQETAEVAILARGLLLLRSPHRAHFGVWIEELADHFGLASLDVFGWERKVNQFASIVHRTTLKPVERLRLQRLWDWLRHEPPHANDFDRRTPQKPVARVFRSVLSLNYLEEAIEADSASDRPSRWRMPTREAPAT